MSVAYGAHVARCARVIVSCVLATDRVAHCVVASRSTAIGVIASGCVASEPYTKGASL